MGLKIAIILTLFIVSAANGENWPQWRGPFLNGFTSEKNLPVSWNKTENVIWVAKMPGTGNSTPIIWENYVFITAIEEESKKMWAICLDKSNGQELWKHEMGTGFFTNTGNNGATPSPIVDGERIYFLFGTGDLIAFDMKGQTLWTRNLEKDHGRIQIIFRYGASPLLYKDKLYISVIHRHTRAEAEPDKPEPMSYLLCIDPKTGKDLWKQKRDTDAMDESMEAYTTPYPYQSPNGTLIIVSGGDYVTAHDPDNGKEIWRTHNLNPQDRRNYRLVPSPVSVNGMLIFFQARGGAIYAMKGDKSGQLTEDDLAWVIWENAPDVCSPLVMDGKLFILDGDRRIMSCINPENGQVYWKGRLESGKVFQSSPTGADGKIYCMNMAGEVTILSAGESFNVLSSIDMGEGICRSTISASDGKLFIRTAENLYCIGNKTME
ncbi:hypothetical protein FJZ33_01730 [Candidatus Poribacteria bacterium]|nr:hypothetical protein [Candidatus Poribacteria bacterium]